MPTIIRPRIAVTDDFIIGPGKIDLLRAIEAHGSISAAARSLGMGYRRAWALVDALNRNLPNPVLESIAGGKGGGGAKVTDAGAALIRAYDEIEAACKAAAHPGLDIIRALVS
ncbi:hypothetical protein BKK81_17845 [Cupriavidus sp. USMAHM13]|nr:hypothetical protein BKK81_17845 [Cupriavidus sp. USMAHM13]